MVAERELIEGLRKGLEDSYDRLVEIYGDKVLKICYFRLGNINEAEDATQEVFIKIFRSIGGFNGKSSLYTWIYRITANCCSNYRRSIRPTENLDKYEGFLEGDKPVENQLLERDRKEYILSLIRELEEKYREVIFLYYYEEKSVLEISEILSCSENTVKTRLRRARERMEKSLRGGMACELY